MHRFITSFFVALMIVTPPVTHLGDIAICAVSENAKGKNYVFSGFYPRFSGMGDKTMQKSLNVQMRELAQGALARSRAAAVRLQNGDRPGGQTAEGVFVYEVKRNGGGIVSLMFTDTLNNGKEPTKQIKSGLTFYAKSGKTIKLTGMFTNGEKGLGLLNRELKKQLDERGLMSALQKSNPVVDADQTFYLTEDCIVLVINENTWFGQAIGTVEFPIKLDKLKSCLLNAFVP